MVDYISIMFSFLKKAGEIALSQIDARESDLKPDESIITEADRAISRLAHEDLASLLKTPNHILIDEEDPRRVEYLDQKILKQTPFIWSVDPIDATRAFANRMPHYGISIGLIKNLKPWMGAVYFPSLKELFFCDGEQAYFVQNAFSRKEKKTLIEPFDEDLTRRSVFISTDEIFENFEWQAKDARVMVFASAICEFCWPAIGRGCGSLSMVHLWDIAGSWPIFEKAGLKMRSLKNGRVLDRLDVELFDKKKTPWRFKEYYILSSEKNYKELRSRLKPKKRIK